MSDQPNSPDPQPADEVQPGSTHPDAVEALDEKLEVENADEDQPTEEYDAVAAGDADPQPDAVDEDHVDDHGVDGGEAASDSTDPAPAVDERANANDLRDEQYERATVDPEFAVQQAIDVPEDERGPAWEAGSLADYERAQANEAQAAEDDDSDGEV